MSPRLSHLLAVLRQSNGGPGLSSKARVRCDLECVCAPLPDLPLGLPAYTSSDLLLCTGVWAMVRLGKCMKVRCLERPTTQAPCKWR